MVRTTVYQISALALENNATLDQVEAEILRIWETRPEVTILSHRRFGSSENLMFEVVTEGAKDEY